jgi:hypothetical protein
MSFAHTSRNPPSCYDNGHILGHSDAMPIFYPKICGVLEKDYSVTMIQQNKVFSKLIAAYLRDYASRTSEMDPYSFVATSRSDENSLFGELNSSLKQASGVRVNMPTSRTEISASKLLILF